MMAARPAICAIKASNDPGGDGGCGLTIPAENPQTLEDTNHQLRPLDAQSREGMSDNEPVYVKSQHRTSYWHSGLVKSF